MTPLERQMRREQTSKAHHLLVTNTRRKLQLRDDGQLFAVAGLYVGNYGQGIVGDTLAHWQKHGQLKPWIENFCIDYLAGRIKDLVIDFHQIKAVRNGKK